MDFSASFASGVEPLDPPMA
jgi:hypothetical protein